MEHLIEQGPFKVRTSFALLKEAFEEQLNASQYAKRKQAELALEIFNHNPNLVLGFDTLDSFKENSKDIDNLMSFLFPETLTCNELKCALHPMSHTTFYESQRLHELKKDCIEDFHLPFMSLYDKNDAEITNFLPYAVILNKYYGFDIDFSRPTTVSFKFEDGTVRKYRATYNADFLDIYPQENAIDITQEILDELLLNTNNYEVWKKYFPSESWLLEGFAILNLVDTTLDEQIDVFKEHLIAASIEASFDTIIQDIRQILGVSD